MSESRKAFENQYDSDYLGRDEDGYYKWMSTQEEWELWDSAWQAAREGVEGEPVAVVDRVGIMQRLSPYTNLPEGTKLYTHHASRQAVEGDSESIIGFHNALQRVKKIFSEYRQDWPKWGKRLDGTPALNDLPVRIAAAFSELYTQPVSFGADDYPDCDTCGASINYMPWHYSKGTDRHLHSCDMCWPKVNPASADVPEKWRTVMKELADDLESEIEARRSGDLDRRIERDLIVVKEARVLLNEQEQGL